MPAPASFDYAVVRVVPRPERGEFMNAGVVLHCRTRCYLGVRVLLDRARLAALSPHADADDIAAHLDAFAAVAEGRADAGPIAALPMPERFHWLVAPRSAVLQISPVHCGLGDDPAAALEALYARMVLEPR